MTTIKIKRNNQNIICVECSNHTGFAEYGKDIVCAGVSCIVQTAVLGIKKLTNLSHNVVIDEMAGYLKLEIKDIENSKDFDDAQTILKTMLCGLEDLQKQYPKNIKLEDK